MSEKLVMNNINQLMYYKRNWYEFFDDFLIILNATFLVKIYENNFANVAHSSF